ncbi:hypothetical protein ACLB2K_019896 [Fragaria x ananassa]
MDGGSPRMNGGTCGVRGWLAGEQHQDMGGRPRERDIKWAKRAPKAKALFASSRGPEPGRGAKSGGMSRGRVCRDWGHETKSVSLLRLREVRCPDLFLGIAHRRVGLGRRSGRLHWVHWKTVCLMAVKASYLAIAHPSEGERESQIYSLSPRDFWAKLVYLELVSNVGLFAILWSASSFGGVLPLDVTCDKVSDFLTVGRTWNVHLIEEHFEQADVDLILAMPLSRRLIQNKLIWHYDPKGRFSTRSAYQLARQLLHDSPSGSNNETAHVWKSVWFSSIPVWKERNLRVWEGKSHTCSQVFYQVRSYDTLIRSCLLKKAGGKRQFRPWVPPPNGWLKANFDGAFDSTTNCGGIGVVFRDEQSLVVGGKFCCIAHVNSPEIVEAMAGRMACELAKELHLSQWFLNLIA